jgi:hypothetical protein
MSLAYIDITDLKNERADSGKYLRWVESKLSWYMSSPTSTATSDDDTVILPNTGAGRWLKQKSATDTGTGLSSSIVNSNTTLNINTKSYCDTTLGSIELTLPASPSTGSLVSIYGLVGTSSTNKIVINRNGNNIGGIASDREINVLNDFVDLEYVSTYGWFIKNMPNLNALKLPRTAYSVNPPALASTPSYLGIIDYLGKQKNTTTYINPSTTNGGTRTKRIALATDANFGTGGTGIGINSILFNKAPTADFYIETHAATTFGISLLIDFTSTGSARLNKIQLSTLEGRFSSRFSSCKIYGADNLDVTGYTLDTISRNRKIENCFQDLQLIANLTDTFTASLWNLSGGNYHTLLPVNSSKFYRYYIIWFPTSIILFNQLEFFGDISTD